MTLAELTRFVESRKRQIKAEAQQQAFQNYILADLIGRSVARIYSSSNEIPSLKDAYPTLFDEESFDEEIQKKKDELSALRFKQFAQSFNNRFKKEGDKKA